MTTQEESNEWELEISLRARSVHNYQNGISVEHRLTVEAGDFLALMRVLGEFDALATQLKAKVAK